MLKSMCSNSVVDIVEFCVHLLEGLLIDDDVDDEAREFSFICEHDSAQLHLMEEGIRPIY